MPGSSETGRQIVHILVGALSLLLRWLTWWQAALLAIAAALGNFFLLPRFANSRRLFRPGDLDAPVGSGIVIYPLAVLGLILCFPKRLDIAAGAWAILAAGDGFATLVGLRVRSPALPWNRAKSVAGLVAFIVFGAIAALAVVAWTTNAKGIVPWWWVLIAPPIAALVAGFVETAPLRLNDNISVPVIAALVLWSISLLDVAAWRGAQPDLEARLWTALAINIAVAFAGWLARTVTGAGALTGAVIGIAVYLGTGGAGWTLLFSAFAAAAVATRLGYRRKMLVGIAESAGGRRGTGNAIANTGVAAWFAFLSAGMTDGHLARLAMVAALVTSASDTVASEIGKAWGKTTFLVTSFRRVRPGTSGAISSEGTIAGIVSALLLGALAVWLSLIPAAWLLPVVLAATIASMVESVLGATLEGPGILDNHALNFINSAIGAGLAVVAARIIS
jgi:uncharacterized protein (TIGR00297 family)